MHRLHRTKDFLFNLGASILIVGCSPKGHPQPPSSVHQAHPVTERANLDLECSPQLLELEQTDDEHVEVTGCKRRASYSRLCSNGNNAAGTALTGHSWDQKNCTWVLRDVTSESEARPPNSQ